MQKKIILFELNEVPWRIIEHFRRAHSESNLAKIMPQSQIYETYAEDTCLSPWITWPSVHRGVTNQKHGISSFGQPLEEIDKTYPTIWQLLTTHGFKVGVFGSLHTYPLPKNNLDNYSFFFPDAFAAGAECFPKKLSVFQDFNLQMSRASARNVSMSVAWRPALRLLSNLPGLGIGGSTILDGAKQLLAERIDSTKACRRRTYQVVLAFDIFMQQLERTKPDFTTFFTNHVASSMHRFWAAAYPDDYSCMGYSDEWISCYKDEIMFAMSKFDEMLGRLVSFIARHPGYELWITSSMGQAATVAEPIESQLYITNLTKFMTFFGIHDWEQRPAMAPDISVRVGAAEQESFYSALGKLLVCGRPLKCERKGGFFGLCLGHPNLKADTAEFDGRRVPFSELGMSNVVIEDLTNSTAYHIPAGSLIIYRRSPTQCAQISTTDIFDGIKNNYGLVSAVTL